jgi:Ca2+-transporting ATPase
MTVSGIWLPGGRYSVTGVGYSPRGKIRLDGRAAGSAPAGESPWELDQHLLLVAAGLCNNARLLPPNDENPGWTVLGDPTEAALRVAAQKGGIDLEAEARRSPRILELPFDSRRKRMSTIHKDKDSQLVYVKGAPKEVLALCTYVRQDGQVLPMDNSQRTRIMAATDDYACNGLRVLAVAYRQLPEVSRSGSVPVEYTPESIERNLTFLGLVAMMDPPRPEVAEAVMKCHTAGIRIIMITGDYGLTAESIARRIGILKTSHPKVITGVDLDALDAQALKEVLGQEVIFARVAPEH